jgi:hypothetical protein
MNSIYGRANACVACHLNLDEPIRAAGHPIAFRAGCQCAAHHRTTSTARPSLGPRLWLTGQAAALREMSWKLAAGWDERSPGAGKRLSAAPQDEAGRSILPEGENFSAMQTAADKLARHSSETSGRVKAWPFCSCSTSRRGPSFRPEGEKLNLQRRAEVLVPAIESSLGRYHRETEADGAVLEPTLRAANLLAREHDDFEPARFSSVLEQMEGALRLTVRKADAVPAPRKAAGF